MKALWIFNSVVLFCLSGCQSKDTPMDYFKSGTVKINGIDLYYEVYGQGKPLLLLHGGGSTIQSNFEKLYPFLLKADK